MRIAPTLALIVAAVPLAACGSTSVAPGTTASQPSSAPTTISFPVKGHGYNLEIRLVAATSEDSSRACGAVPFGLRGETPTATECAAYNAFSCPDMFRDYPDGSRIACNVTSKYLLGPALNAPAPAQAVSIGTTGSDWQITVQLNANGARVMAAVTRRIAGNGTQVALVVDGTVLESMTASQAINGGAVQITGGLTQKMASRIAGQLTGASTN